MRRRPSLPPCTVPSCTTSSWKRYLCGWRCRDHTPAALAGRAENAPDPALTLAGLLAAARADVDEPVTAPEPESNPHGSAPEIKPAPGRYTGPRADGKTRPGHFSSDQVDMRRVRIAMAEAGAIARAEHAARRQARSVERVLS